MINTTKEFEQQRLLNLIEKYGFPRRIGTKGERTVYEMIVKEFEDIQLEPIRESFFCDTFYSHLLFPFSILNIICIIIIYETVSILKWKPYFLLIEFIFMVLGIFFLLKFQFPHKMLFHRKIKSENVFTFIPSKNHGKYSNLEQMKIEKNKNFPPGIDKFTKQEYNIIFSAHSDSKSQKFTTKIRTSMFKFVFYYMIALILILFFGIVMLFIVKDHFLVFNLIRVVEGIILLSLFVFSIILLFNKSGNKSLGVLDNASGMAVVFTLAKYFKKNPLQNCNIWCIQFGAEEFGQMGSRNFIGKRDKYFDRKKTFNFNFDMVSEASEKNVTVCEYVGFKPHQAQPFLMKFIDDSANLQEIQLTRTRLIAGWTDRRVFDKYKYYCLDFIAENSLRWTHSIEDTIDKVNPTTLSDLCRLISKTAELMDGSFKKA